MNRAKSNMSTGTNETSRGYFDPPQIPDHSLLRRIGEGSYGEVWLGRSVTGAYRAVKIIYRNRFGSAKPFEREFKGILRFEPVSRTHESQVDILHVGSGPDYFFYIMELADDVLRGREIDSDHYAPHILSCDLLNRGRLEVAECLEIALTLTTALEHLHQHGLVHRDIKPSNIIFVDGKAKLADIGLVSHRDATLSVVGTEGFIPPEGPGTPQADIFSLGKVLYEASTGRDRTHFPELPTEFHEFSDREKFLELNAVINKACRKNADERYRSAREMQEDLALLQKGKSIRKVHATRRRLALLGKVAVVAGLLGASAVGYEFLIANRLAELQAPAHPGQGRLANRLPMRDPAATAAQIDLSDYYNVTLPEFLHANTTNSETVIDIPSLWEIDGIHYDVRGLIQLNTQNLRIELGDGEVFPSLMNGIRIGQYCEKLYFLHGALAGAPADQTIGFYLVNFANGHTTRVPIQYGRHIRDVYTSAGNLHDLPEAKLVRQFLSPGAPSLGRPRSVYAMCWTNPHPNLLVWDVSFVAKPTLSPPFLLAITAETGKANPPSDAEIEQAINNDLTSFLDHLRANADHYPRINRPDGAAPSGEFCRLNLEMKPDGIDGEFFSAVRFTTPPRTDQDFLWAFTCDDSQVSWGMQPVRGSLQVGFEEWWKGKPEIIQNAPQGISDTIVLQFLDGRKLMPKSDYLLWFTKKSDTPLILHLKIVFSPHGVTDPNEVESLLTTLGLNPLFSAKVDGQNASASQQFFRVYCLGAYASMWKSR